jgi:ubiquitin carboxyl-terminal hydrolase 7
LIVEGLILTGIAEKKLDEEAALKEARKKERDEQHLYLNARVVTDETFRAHSGTDLTTFDHPEKDAGAARSYRVLRSSTIRDLTVRVAKDLGQDPRRIRFWCMVNRQNKTIRPDQPILDLNQTIEQSYQKLAGTKLQEFRIWAEVAEDVEPNGEVTWPGLLSQNGTQPKSDNILLFLKWFDVEEQALRGVGHIYIGKDRKVEDLVSPILKKMGWPEKSPTGDRTQLKLYEVSSLTRALEYC